MNERDIFIAALQKDDPEERRAYLDDACAARPELREAVENLLRLHGGAGSFLEPRAASPATGPFPNPDQPAAPSEISGTLIGPYKLLEEVGTGGMGSVWMAQQQEPVKRLVAVKLIKPGMDSKQVLARFEAERQALALMDHPNIARVLDAGTTADGRPFFVMELVKGVTITKFCDAHRLTPRQRLELFVPVCQAIQHAHQKGIIHRDIKPSNVLVAVYDDKPVPKVIDFGIAKATGQQLTEATLNTGFGAVVGTLEYMSPEQASFNQLDVDTRSDIYSLGVLLYELMAGSPPFSRRELEKAGMLEMLRVIREQEPAKPSTKLSTADGLPTLAANRGTESAKLTRLVRGELDWIVMKSLEKERNRRYETANGFAQDVQRYLADEPVAACPPSVGYRLRKFVRRNKGSVLAAAVVVATLIAGITGTSIGLVRAELARVKAEEKEKEALKAAAEEHQAKLNEAAQLAIAVDQRAKAEKARDRTRAALDAMTSDVTNDALETQSAVTPEQKKFLAEVLTYYREFAGERPEDEQSRWRTATAAQKVVVIENRLGHVDNALAACRQARDGFAGLAADFPAVPGHRRNLAVSLYRLGVLLNNQGHRTEAKIAFRDASTLWNQLVAASPNDPDYRLGLATAQAALGMVQTNLDKWREGEAEVRLALTLLGKIAAEFPAVPLYRHNQAQTHWKLGLLYGEHGDWVKAEAECRQALLLQRKLADDFPAVREYRMELATSHTLLAQHLELQSKRNAAEIEYRQAQPLLAKLTADFPSVPEYRAELFGCHLGQGTLYARSGKLTEAEVEYRVAMTLIQKLNADFPASSDYRLKLATCHNNLGIVLKMRGQYEAARTEFQAGRDVRRKLVDEFPANLMFQINLGGDYCNYGDLLRVMKRAAESLEWFDQAIRVLKPIHEREPRDVLARDFLMNSYTNRAKANVQLDQPAKVAEDFGRLIELDPTFQRPSYRVLRVGALLDAGQVLAALAEVPELTKRSNWDAEDWVIFAGVYARGMKAVPDKKDEYADKTVELLGRAVKAGYKDEAKLSTVKEFDPLRDRQDFKKLMSELKK